MNGTEGGGVCVGVVVPRGDMFESKCLYICYVSWKKPTDSKNSSRTNGYFPVSGDNSGTTLNESLGGVPPAPQILAPPHSWVRVVQ